MVYLTQYFGIIYKDTSLNGHYNKDNLIELILKFNKVFYYVKNELYSEFIPFFF